MTELDTGGKGGIPTETSSGIRGKNMRRGIHS